MVLVRVNCKRCLKKCCGKIANLRPILLPFEEKRFKKYSAEIKNPIRNLWKIKEKSNKNCIFFNDKIKKCIIWNNKPFECDIYPYLLKLSKNAKVRLDKKQCKEIREIKVNKKKIKMLLSKLKHDKKFIKAYNKYTKLF